jgi:hypothetical protein
MSVAPPEAVGRGALGRAPQRSRCGRHRELGARGQQTATAAARTIAAMDANVSNGSARAGRLGERRTFGDLPHVASSGTASRSDLRLKPDGRAAPSLMTAFGVCRHPTAKIDRRRSVCFDRSGHRRRRIASGRSASYGKAQPASRSASAARWFRCLSAAEQWVEPAPSTQGSGYLAAVVVNRPRGSVDGPRQAYRDTSTTLTYQWPLAEIDAPHAFARHLAQAPLHKRTVHRTGRRLPRRGGIILARSGDRAALEAGCPRILVTHGAAVLECQATSRTDPLTTSSFDPRLLISSLP